MDRANLRQIVKNTRELYRHIALGTATANRFLHNDGAA
jgi:hypothetical protein